MKTKDDIYSELFVVKENTKLIATRLSELVGLLKRIDFHLTPVTLPAEIKEEKEDQSVELLRDIKDLVSKIEKYGCR